MNNKINLPKKILNLLLEDDFEKKINRVFSLCYEKTKPKLLLDSINELKNEISNANNLSDYQKKMISDLDNDKIKFLSTAFILALKVDNIIKQNKYSQIIYQNGANSVDLVFGDIFKFGFDNRKREKNIIVIPVNTSFETHITAKVEKEKFPLVSEKTIHGMWLSRMYKCNYREEEINNSIKLYLERYST